MTPWIPPCTYAVKFKTGQYTLQPRSWPNLELDSKDSFNGWTRLSRKFWKSLSSTMKMSRSSAYVSDLPHLDMSLIMRGHNSCTLNKDCSQESYDLFKFTWWIRSIKACIKESLTRERNQNSIVRLNTLLHTKFFGRLFYVAVTCSHGPLQVYFI